MAQFEKKKIDLEQINGGKRYENGDGIQAETINAVVEGVAFAQENGGSGTVETDKTLTIENAPADAKVVGEKLEELKEELNNVGLEIVRLY